MFNYDTKIVVGRKPLIREREILTSELQVQTEQLQKDAVEKLAFIADSITAVNEELTGLSAGLQEMQSLQSNLATLIGKVEEKLAAADSVAAEAEAIKDNGTQASVDGADAARACVVEIQSILDRLRAAHQTISDDISNAVAALAEAKAIVEDHLPALQERMLQQKAEIDGMFDAAFKLAG